MNNNSFTRRGGRLYRAGLEYEHEAIDGETYLRYIPDGVFHVDGIRYQFGRGVGVNCISSMCEVRPQGAGSGVDWQQISRPPTEAELDDYVRTGRLPR